MVRLRQVQGWNVVSILERDLERVLVKASPLPIIKLTPQGRRGWPDRLIMLPGGSVIFVELKRPGEVLRPLQRHVREQLQGLGHTVVVLDERGRAFEELIAMLHEQLEHWHEVVNDDDPTMG